MPTPTQQLIEIRLGRSLDEYIDERLKAKVGWRRIASDVRGQTNISVSHETLRSWYMKRAA